MRLPETVQTLYAELLDQARAADAEPAAGGSYVSKTIRGATYWYLQQSAGGRKRQLYIGRDSPELRERMRIASQQRSNVAADERQRRELIAMLAAGGMARESAAVGSVLQILADADVFRAGGVLVGTQAFGCLANMLGVRFEEGSLRTADIDVALDVSIPLQRLATAEPRFFALPRLGARKPSASFKVRGRDLRVNFLTPGNLDYLIDEPVDAVVLAAAGVHVNVPAPARFALHKLWVASQRPASEQAKARKDRRQAEQLLEVLLSDRPEDVIAAYRALRPGMLRKVQKTLRTLDAPLQDRLRAVVA